MQTIEQPEEQRAAEQKSRRKWLQSVLYGVAALAFFALKIWSRSRHGDDAPDAAPDAGANPLAPYAPFFLAGAAALSLLTLSTNAFTFDFARPRWHWLKLRLFLCLAAAMGLAIAGAVPLEGAVAARLGLADDRTALLGAGLLVVVLIYLLITLRVRREAVLRRLGARGLHGEDLLRGTLVTLALAGSARSGMARDFEAGLLWLEGTTLRFLGDQLDLRAQPGQVKVEREIIPGSLPALLGRKGLLLTLPSADGDLRLEVAPLDALLPSTWSAGVERIATEVALWRAG